MPTLQAFWNVLHLLAMKLLMLENMELGMKHCSPANDEMPLRHYIHEDVNPGVHKRCSSLFVYIDGSIISKIEVDDESLTRVNIRAVLKAQLNMHLEYNIYSSVHDITLADLEERLRILEISRLWKPNFSQWVMMSNSILQIYNQLRISHA